MKIWIPPRLLRFLLRSRWKGQKERILAIINAIHNGNDWTLFLIPDESHSFGPMKNMMIRNIPVLEGDKGPRDLRGIELSDVSFSGCNVLGNTRFDFATLSDIDFSLCTLNACFFRYAKINGRKETSFYGAALNNCTFSGADVRNVIFDESNALNLSFSDCSLHSVSMNNVKWKKVKTNGEYCFSHLIRFLLIFIFPWILGYRRGTKISALHIQPRLLQESDLGFKSYINTEIAIQELKMRHITFSYFLYGLADYGKNLLRLMLNIIITWFIFGFIYSGFTIPGYVLSNKTLYVLKYVAPDINWGKFSLKNENTGTDLCTNEEVSQFNNQNWFTPYYFSVVTMTTLGYGDISPNDWKGQIYCCVEALLGFIYLSVFVSIFISRFVLMNPQ